MSVAGEDTSSEKVMLTDPLSNSHTPVKVLEDEFHDACSFSEVENNPNECGDEIFEDALADEKPAPIIIEDQYEERRKLEEVLSMEELEKMKSDSVQLKNDGNILFKSADYNSALEKYTQALHVCPLIYSSDRAKIYSNRAACHSQLGSSSAALLDCDEAIKLEPDYMRCLIRRAELRESSDRLTEALEDYQHILELDPDNKRARAACVLLPDKINAQQEKMKQEMFGQLKQLGNMVLKPFGLSTDNFKVTKDPTSGGYSINFANNPS